MFDVEKVAKISKLLPSEVIATKDDIQARMVEDFQETNSESTTMEGSFVRDIINANSSEFEYSNILVTLLAAAAFANTSWGEFLTRRCREYGIDRNQAVKAKGKVTFTGNPGAVIPKGTKVAAVDSFQFETTEDSVIDENGQAEVPILATTPGYQGNYDVNKIVVLPVSVQGIHSVTNENPTDSGADEESDGALLKRYEYAIRNPQTSGNRYHYYNWAMAVDGVGSCQVVPLWAGPGTVKVIILNQTGQTASEDLLTRVHDYIEEKRPIGADVTVVSPEPLKVTISITNLVGQLDSEQLKQDVQDYCTSQGLNLTSLSNTQVGKFVMKQAGVKDFDYIKLNNQKRIFPEDKIIVIEQVRTS